MAGGTYLGTTRVRVARSCQLSDGCRIVHTAPASDTPNVSATSQTAENVCSKDRPSAIEMPSHAHMINAGDQATSAIQGEAQKLLDQAMQYIKENKFELADQALVKLEGMKAQLPETMQKSIAQARTALDTAKKGAGMLPGSGK